MFFASDTTGEKDFEEFFTDSETLDMDRFANVGIVKNRLDYDPTLLDEFCHEIAAFRASECWEKGPIVDLFNRMIPEFNHLDTGRYLDGRM